MSNVCPDSHISITKQAPLKAIWMCIRVSIKAVCLFNHSTLFLSFSCSILITTKYNAFSIRNLRTCYVLCFTVLIT